jgi:hypothetical protein
MSTPAGIENTGGQGQGPVNLNGNQGTASGLENPVQFGQLQQQPQQFNQPPAQQAPYADYLSRVPESLRGSIEPIFRDWDAQTTQRFQQYADQLRQLQPYQQFASAGYDPQSLQMAAQLAELVQSDPEQVFKLLAQQLDYDLDDEDLSGYSDPDSSGQDDWRNSIETALNDLTEMIQSNQDQAQEDREAENILNMLQETEQQHGTLDYEWVLTKAAATNDLDGAVREYYERYYRPEFDQNPQQQQQQQLNGLNGLNGNGQQQQQGMVEVGGIMVPANHPAAQSAGPPNPLGAGGGLPSEQQDLGKLDRKSRVELVTQLLNTANQAASQA